MPRMDCVVHTPGILFEQDYKSNGVQSLAKAIAGNLTGQWKARSASKNPLRVDMKSEEDGPIFVSEETGNFEKYHEETLQKRNEAAQRKPREEKTYECINVQTARSVLRGFLRSKPENSVLEYVHDAKAKSTLDITTTSPFVYISAEDIFRPFVPEEYITSKRRAEKEIIDCAKYIEYKTKRPEDEEEGYIFRPGWDAQQAINDLTNTHPKRYIRPILVRPGKLDSRPAANGDE